MKTIICTPYLVRTTENFSLNLGVNTYYAIERQNKKKTKRKQDD